LEASRRLLEEALARFRREGDLWGISLGLSGLADIAFTQRDLSVAKVYYEESLALRRQVGERMSLANALANVAHVALEQDDLATAVTMGEERLALALGSGALRYVAETTLFLGRIALDMGDVARAAAHLEKSLSAYQALDDNAGMAAAASWLGRVAVTNGHLPRARSWLHQGRHHARRSLDPWVAAHVLEGGATLAAVAQEWEKCARLLGAAHVLRERYARRMAPRTRAEHDRLLAAARQALGEAVFASAWAEGQAHSQEQALDWVESAAL
jgi:hypothetical protein